MIDELTAGYSRFQSSFDWKSRNYVHNLSSVHAVGGPLLALIFPHFQH